MKPGILFVVCVLSILHIIILGETWPSIIQLVSISRHDPLSFGLETVSSIILFGRSHSIWSHLCIS